MKIVRKTFVILFWLAAVFILPSLAHNYHTSLTRIDFNKEAKSLEIEINLFNHDLEKVLESKYKKRVDFENAKEFEKMLFAYLNETFIVKDTNDSLKELVWVGKEIETDLTTVYFEIKEIEGIENLKLQNKIFLANFGEQTNLVTIHSGNNKFDFLFKAGDDFKSFMTENKKSR